MFKIKKFLTLLFFACAVRSMDADDSKLTAIKLVKENIENASLAEAVDAEIKQIFTNNTQFFEAIFGCDYENLDSEALRETYLDYVEKLYSYLEDNDNCQGVENNFIWPEGATCLKDPVAFKQLYFKPSLKKKRKRASNIDSASLKSLAGLKEQEQTALTRTSRTRTSSFDSNQFTWDPSIQDATKTRILRDVAAKIAKKPQSDPADLCAKLQQSLINKRNKERKRHQDKSPEEKAKLQKKKSAQKATRNALLTDEERAQKRARKRQQSERYLADPINRQRRNASQRDWYQRTKDDPKKFEIFKKSREKFDNREYKSAQWQKMSPEKKAQQKDRLKKYNQDNKEHVKEVHRQWLEKNKEDQAVKRRVRRGEKAEHINELARDNYYKNQDKFNELLTNAFAEPIDFQPANIPHITDDNGETIKPAKKRAKRDS